MESFATDLLESVQNLDDRNASAQDTQSEVADRLWPENSSLRTRLDRLSGFRIHTDAITFTSSGARRLGGKAEVVKATVKLGGGSDEQQVAVKKLRYADDINGRKLGNEFVHEVDIMAHLSHKNIVRLIGFVEDLEEGKAWIILSWEPNGNVSEFLTTGEWEIPERISLIQDTFAGIDYLHTLQPPVCHGDLKSLNILVSSSYRAVITDFGSARILKGTKDRHEDRDKVRSATGVSALTQVMHEDIDRTKITIVASSNQLTLTGPAWSLRWAAPEVLFGEPQDLASDIWAAGWICWEIMTSKVPFPELTSEGAITLEVAQGQVPIVREDAQLSQVMRLCSLMTECWAFNPRSRPNISRCNAEISWMPSALPRAVTTSDSNTPSAELLCEMGYMYRVQGNCPKAISLYQQALSIATVAANRTTSADALLGLGLSHYLTLKDDDAEQYLTRARDIYIEIGDRKGEADTLYYMAKMYRDQSELAKAEEFYTRAREVYSSIGSEKGRAGTLRGLGCIFFERSHYAEAEAAYSQAQDIYGRIGDYWGQANTLRRLGVLCLERSEYTKAEESLNQALAIYSRIGDNGGRANAQSDLGHLYHKQGLNTKAAPLFAEAKSLYAQMGNSEMEEECSNWIDVVSKEGDSSTTSLSVPETDGVSSPVHQQ